MSISRIDIICLVETFDETDTYATKRFKCYAALVPLHVQLEALTEAASARPEKQDEVLASIALIKELFPKDGDTTALDAVLNGGEP